MPAQIQMLLYERVLPGNVFEMAASASGGGRMNFIKLTTIGGNPIWVNINNICAIYKDGEYNVVDFGFSKEAAEVQESLDEIMQLITAEKFQYGQ